MKNGKKLASALSLALAACMVLSACQGGGASSTTASTGGTASAAQTSSGTAPSTTGVDLVTGNKYKGTPDADMITINLVQEPPEMNSIQMSDTSSSTIEREIMAGLTKLDKNDNPVPDMAESWTVSTDKKTYTFKLRQGQKWSNGDPVTAKDFAFAWTTAMQKKTASVYAFILTDNIQGGDDYFAGKIKEDKLGIKVIDDYNLKVTFSKPIPYALNLFAFQTYLPIDQKAYESITADKYAKDADKIVTNGPYKMTEWKHNDHITLTKNDNYWDKANVSIPKVKFVMIGDANAAINAFKAGQLDEMVLAKDSLAKFKSEGQPIASYNAGSNWYLEYNTKRKSFSNAKIRQAMGMAIDTKSFCDNVLKDGSTPATGLVPTGIAGASGKEYAEARGDISLKFDAAKAKSLLADGLKEIGMTADQFKPVFITDNTTAAVRETTFMQEQWKTNLGINVQLQPMAFKARVNAMHSKDFDMVMAGWSPDYNDAMTFMDMFMTGNGNNDPQYESKTYDDLIKKAAYEPDAAKRQDTLIQAEKLLVQQDCPVFPIWYEVTNYTTSGKFTGATLTAFQSRPGNYATAKMTGK